MRKNYFSLLTIMVMVLFSFWQANAQYCVPVYSTGCTSGDTIDNFVMADAGLEHLGSGCSAGGYGDFSSDPSLVATVLPGETYSFSATHGFGGQFLKIWIDFDGNGSFEDPGELLFTSASGGTTTVGNIVIPSDADPITTRMRVMGRWNSAPLDSCDPGGAWGETHDYTVEIGGGASYCIPVYSTGCTSGDTIDNFVMADAGLEHLGSGCSAGGYGDFSSDPSLVATVLPGETYSFSATHGFGGQFLKIWIDFDGNGSFEDPGELLFTSASGGTTTVGNIVIPSDADPITTRMRVMGRWNSAPLDSCDPGGAWGETHDYTVIVEAGGGASYCIPVFSTGCTSGDDIDDFIMTDAGLEHLDSGCSPGGYGDFTSDPNLVATVTAGETYDFTATHNFGSQRVKIWIDFDGNGSFEDSGELVYTSPAGSNPTVGTVSIPSDVDPITSRMRVMTRWSSLPTDSCDAGGAWGEAHDYTIVIEAGGGGGGDECTLETLSNGVEDGTPNSLWVTANDIIVPADESFTMDQVIVPILTSPGTTILYADLTYYDNSGSNLPGATLGSENGITPTSQVIIGSAFGYDVREVVLDITPFAFEAGASDTNFWVQIHTPNSSGSATYWESNTSGPVWGYPAAAFDGVVWSYNWGANYDGVFQYNGECSGSGGGGECEPGDLTTIFTGGNQFAGNMFDITASGGEDLQIESFDINMDPGSGLISVYYKSGSYIGFESDASAWTLLGAETVTSMGENNPTPLNVGGLTIPAGETYGIYISSTDYATNNFTMNYTNGDFSYTDAYMTIETGVGKGSPDFTGSTFASRSWNGTVYYCAGEGGGGGGGCEMGQFNSRVDFEAAFDGTLNLEDFAGGPGALVGCDGPINNSGNSCFPAGEILPGISITTSTPGEVDPMVFLPAGSFGNTIDMVGSNQFSSFTIIEFPDENVDSFGFDVQAFLGGGNIDIRIYGATSGLLDTYTINATSQVFFGYIASEILDRVELEDLTGLNVELIGNLAFGLCEGGGGGDCEPGVMELPFDASFNQFAGNMFDVAAIGGDEVIIEGFDVNIDPGTATIAVYYREGTYVGFENSSAGWTLLGTEVVTSAGENMPTHVEIGGVTIPDGETYGFYVSVTDYDVSGVSMNYTNGSNVFSDTYVEVTLGVGKGNPDFLGATFADRIWNGNIYYCAGEGGGGGGGDCEWEVHVFDTTGNFGDEVTWQLLDGATVLLSGGPYFTTPYNDVQTIMAGNGPLTFQISSMGVFNDNTPSYTVTAGGTEVASGTLAGGTEAIHEDLMCDGSGGNDPVGDCDEANERGTTIVDGLNCSVNSTFKTANDLTVPADYDFHLEQIRANILTIGEVTEVSVYYYDNNTSTNLPGTQLDSEMNLVPSEQTWNGSAFGFDVYEIILDIPTYIFSGQESTETTYWIELEVNNGASSGAIYWELTNENSQGNPAALFDGSWMVWDPTMDGVYLWGGNCVEIISSDEVTISGFSYYPNPANDVIYLQADQIIDSVDLYNVLGQQVLSQSVNAQSSQLDVSGLASGTYLMSVQSEGTLHTYQVIKK